MIVVNARFLTQPITGVQRFAIEISLELKKILGDEVTFVAPNRIIQSHFTNKFDVVTIGSHQGYLWEQWDLPLYLKKRANPLLLCLCNTAPLFYRNKIVTVHDVAFKVYPQTFNKSFLYVYRFMIPCIMRSAKRVITVSEFSKSEIVKYYKIECDKISVVYNAVGPEFHRVEEKKLHGEKYMLAVSSLNYRKNFSAVLKAFSVFEETDNETSLYIIGDLKSTNFVGIDIGQYKDNTRIKFLGRVSDKELVRYYSNAAAFVYPSIYEGFGIPPLEAQSCGCPVLVADIPPLHEVIGDSGIYCNPHDVCDIAEKMQKVLTYSSELRAKGNVNTNRFSWEMSARKVADIIKEINR